MLRKNIQPSTQRLPEYKKYEGREKEVKTIDGGKPFDWGNVSAEYARYRDIYPPEFYKRITDRGLCTAGQKVLDVGTGTGVLPRHLYRYGAQWTGVDCSENQIRHARILSEGTGIAYEVCPAEEISFPVHSFDVITACQCFWYFDHERVMPKFHDIIKPGGRLLILYMAWLPSEDKIAGASEKLVLKYSPHWSGAGETMHPIEIPSCYTGPFSLIFREEFRLQVPFSRETWNGRMKACRGIGASLSENEVLSWEQEHMALLEKIAPENFEIQHYGAIAELRRE